MTPACLRSARAVLLLGSGQALPPGSACASERSVPGGRLPARRHHQDCGGRLAVVEKRKRQPGGRGRIDGYQPQFHPPPRCPGCPSCRPGRQRVCEGPIGPLRWPWVGSGGSSSAGRSGQDRPIPAPPAPLRDVRRQPEMRRKLFQKRDKFAFHPIDVPPADVAAKRHDPVAIARQLDAGPCRRVVPEQVHVRPACHLGKPIEHRLPFARIEGRSMDGEDDRLKVLRGYARYRRAAAVKAPCPERAAPAIRTGPCATRGAATGTICSACAGCG